MFSKALFFSLRWLKHDVCAKKQNYACLLHADEFTVNSFPNKPWFFMCLQYKSFENTVGKGENEQFLLFPQCFLPIWRTFYHFHQI